MARSFFVRNLLFARQTRSAGLAFAETLLQFAVPQNPAQPINKTKLARRN
jgi:hypothetical protein